MSEKFMKCKYRGYVVHELKVKYTVNGKYVTDNIEEKRCL